VNERNEAQSVVFVVDDDSYVRDGLQRLFRSVGLQSEVFGSTADFLKSTLPDAASCLVLDIRLPGLSGLDFQAELARANIAIPVIFITGHGDIPMSVRAMKAGAVEFLTKPVREQDLLDAVRVALDRAREIRQSGKTVSDLRARFESLTARERAVLTWVTTGLMNKQTAAAIGISEISVKVHRHNAMKKMGAKSLADMVRMAEVLRIGRPKP
jgi:FixJ family two-component response regulator